jgi:hypothetical protein
MVTISNALTSMVYVAHYWWVYLFHATNHRIIAFNYHILNRAI